MEIVFGLVAVLTVAIILARLYVLEQRRYRKQVDDVLPSIDCKDPKKIRAIYDRYAFVAIDDIKSGDLLEVVPAYEPGDIFCYGDDGLCGNYWGASFKDHIDGSGCEGMVYKDGMRHQLGKFESKAVAIETAIKMLTDSESPQDANTLDQLKIWLAEETEKNNN